MITLDEVLQQIHRKYEGNITYPTAGTDDYALRTGFVVDSIRRWAYTENVKWKELYTTLQQASTGTKTTTSGTYSYAMPTDLQDLGGSVTVGSVQYTYIPASQVSQAQTRGDINVFYITGSPGAYYINFIPTPTIDGQIIDYPYYKKPNTTLSGSTVLEMTMPDFAVFSTLAALYELDTNTALETFYEQKAKDVLDQMTIKNESAMVNQPAQIHDYSTKITGFVFGE